MILKSIEQILMLTASKTLLKKGYASVEPNNTTYSTPCLKLHSLSEPEKGLSELR